MSEQTKYDWDELIRRHESSGMGVLDFCEREGIPKSGFYKARKGRGKVSRRSRSVREREDFVEVPLASRSEHQNGEAVVELPGGAVLRFSW